MSSRASVHVIPLCLGHIVRDKSAFIYHTGAGVKITIPIISFLIRTNGKKILIDTGTNAPEETADFHKPLTQTDDQKIEKALEKVGVSPAEIDIVVNTHLHWDHCYNNLLFENARFLVHREELRYAACPLPVHTFGYDSQIAGMRPPYADVKFQTVSGDTELVPGVRLLSTPGHTPGSLSVWVETASGNILIASDTIPLYENLENMSLASHPLPNGIYTDLKSYYETFDKLLGFIKKAKTILPGHDSQVFDSDVYS